MFDLLDTGTLLYRVPALLTALTLHEYAHAYVSSQLGDPTPERQGRLTVNPLSHLDIVGTVMLVLCGFGWAKPVEINPRYYADFKSGVVKVSLAGPGMNLFLGFLAVFIMGAMSYGNLHGGGGGYAFLYWIMIYNVWFAFFNLIPVPPLDGSKLLEMALPPQAAFAFHNVSGQYGFLVLMILVFSGAVSTVLGPLTQGYLTICYTVVSWIW